MNQEQIRAAERLLREIDHLADSGEWPHTQELAADLELLLKRDLPKQQCLVAWTDVMARTTTLWSVELRTEEERAALRAVASEEVPADSDDAQLLWEAIEGRGREVLVPAEGWWLAAKVTVT